MIHDIEATEIINTEKTESNKDHRPCVCKYLSFGIATAAPIIGGFISGLLGAIFGLGVSLISILIAIKQEAILF
jgi:hypothetical protein